MAGPVTEANLTVTGPRASSTGRGLNDQLRDALIRHRLRLALAENAELRNLVRRFTALSGPMRTAWLQDDTVRLADLRAADRRRRLAAVMALFAAAVGQTVQQVERVTAGLLDAEMAFWNTLLPSLMPPTLATAMGLAPLTMQDQEKAGKTAVLGVTAASWETRVLGLFGERSELELAQAEGFDETTLQAATRMSRLAGLLGAGTQGGSKMARTLWWGATAALAALWARRNRRLLKTHVYSAVLDDRTCPVCGGLDGSEYAEGDPRPGLPQHPLCRCMYHVVFRGAKELGLQDLAVPGVVLADYMAPLAGDTMTWDRWIRTLTPQDQLDILGPARYRIWRAAGKPPLRFFTSGGRVIPLDQLLPLG